MARKLSNSEVFDRLSVAGILRDDEDSGAGSTTVPLAIVADAAAFTVATGHGADFDEDTYVRIGEGSSLEVCKIKTIAGDLITPYTPLALDHIAASACVAQVKVQIGEVTPEGVKHNTTLDVNDVKTATTRGTYVRLVRGITQTVSWATPNHSLENLALALGIPETAILGSGTASAPYRLVLKETSVASALNHSCYFTGVLHDGTTVEAHGWGVDFDGSGDITYTSGDAAPIPFSFNVKTVALFVPSL